MTRNKQTIIIIVLFITMVTTVLCSLETITLLKTKLTVENILNIVGTYKTMLLILIANQVLVYIIFFFTFEEAILNSDD